MQGLIYENVDSLCLAVAVCDQKASDRRTHNRTSITAIQTLKKVMLTFQLLLILQAKIKSTVTITSNKKKTFIHLPSTTAMMNSGSCTRIRGDLVREFPKRSVVRHLCLTRPYGDARFM